MKFKKIVVGALALLTATVATAIIVQKLAQVLVIHLRKYLMFNLYLAHKLAL